MALSAYLMKRKKVLNLPFVFLVLTCLCFCISASGQTIEAPATISAEKQTQSDVKQQYRLMPGDILSLRFGSEYHHGTPYRFAPGDQIEIRFISFPDLNIVQRIRPDGMIALPYIGDLGIADSTPEKVRILLESMYSGELNEPQIIVLLKEMGGLRGELIKSVNSNDGAMTMKVRGDGFVSLPFAGEILVAGLTIAEVANLTNEQYRQAGFIGKVDLSLQSPQGARISVFGAVNRPGFYVVEQPMRVYDAIALAGGLRNDAHLRKIAVLRASENGIEFERYNLRRILKGRKTQDIKPLSSMDVVFVPRSGLSKASDISQELIQILLFRGWSLDFGRYLLPKLEESW